MIGLLNSIDDRYMSFESKILLQIKEDKERFGTDLFDLEKVREIIRSILDFQDLITLDIIGNYFYKYLVFDGKIKLNFNNLFFLLKYNKNKTAELVEKIRKNVKVNYSHFVKNPIWDLDFNSIEVNNINAILLKFLEAYDVAEIVPDKDIVLEL